MQAGLGNGREGYSLGGGRGVRGLDFRQAGLLMVRGRVRYPVPGRIWKARGRICGAQSRERGKHNPTQKTPVPETGRRWTVRVGAGIEGSPQSLGGREEASLARSRKQGTRKSEQLQVRIM
ncbi:hypothetical protein NDU88_004758 [Pleurodeles waltl]|uniref:Uncharacterized protein n=1 Tax=Pleurodeles waltl TaxID=8319 RepID=A0AAV7QG41_PLEWA|nr:hypothetical protein NDU88_004758 [Pleurodeles waltl]